MEVSTSLVPPVSRILCIESCAQPTSIIIIILFIIIFFFLVFPLFSWLLLSIICLKNNYYDNIFLKYLPIVLIPSLEDKVGPIVDPHGLLKNKKNIQ